MRAPTHACPTLGCKQRLRSLGSTSVSATACGSLRPWLVSREAGEQKKALSFLPADKQYLVTRNGACRLFVGCRH